MVAKWSRFLLYVLLTASYYAHSDLIFGEKWLPNWKISSFMKNALWKRSIYREHTTRRGGGGGKEQRGQNGVEEMVRNQKRVTHRVHPLGRCLHRCVRANRTPPETLLQREPPETHLAHHIPGANLRFIIVRGVDATETFVGFRHLSGLLRELGGV